MRCIYNVNIHAMEHGSVKVWLHGKKEYLEEGRVDQCSGSDGSHSLLRKVARLQG
ncbi:MAG: hypothetical protein QXU32_11155 [Nitrososphaerales archaeon]